MSVSVYHLEELNLIELIFYFFTWNIISTFQWLFRTSSPFCWFWSFASEWG